MGVETRSRNSSYRRYKKLLASIKTLRGADLISEVLMEVCELQAQSMYSRWKEEDSRARVKSGRPRGRPRSMEDRSYFTICKRLGCGKPPAENQAYCGVSCAPYGHYGLPRSRR